MRLAGISHAYGERPTLADVELACEPAEILALLGPNGAGKTTLLAIAAGLVAPARGKVVLPVTGHRARRAHVGYCPQASLVFADLGLAEQLELAARAFGASRDGARARAREVLGTLELADRADARPPELSGGMLRRFNVAHALVHRPAVLLLDEPSAGLDPAQRAVLHRAIRAERARGASIVLATHDLDEIAALADRVAVLDRGRLVTVAPPGELLARAGARARVEVELEGAPPDVAGLVGRFPEGAASVAGARVVVAIDDVAEGARLVAAALADLGVGVRSIVARRASLGDAYSALTGRSLEP